MSALVASVAMALVAGANAQVLPEGFALTNVGTGLINPVTIDFSADGRIFVAEKRGMVWVIDQNGTKLPEPFIDIRPEVNNLGERGLIGLALDPDFMTNRYVYLLHVVNPTPAPPQHPNTLGTWGRVVRFTGTAESGGNIADPKSKFILIGNGPSDGIPECAPGHTVGTLRFGLDGSLLVGAGDGAKAVGTDAGGQWPSCFQEGWFPASEDLGSFKAQSLDSLAGKILRIDPDTGLGLPDNPFYTGDPDDNRSRVFASGLRNPFRYTIRPGTAAAGGPGTIYIGDVGGGAREAINVARGGENFGWPCYEAELVQTTFWEATPIGWGCDTLESEGNPGPLTLPVMWWSHGNVNTSNPPGYTGKVVGSGVFYGGNRYPPKYHGAYFYADYVSKWLRVGWFDDDEQLEGIELFGSGIASFVDIRPHPISGDLYIVNFFGGQLRRLSFVKPDFNGDGKIDGADLGLMLMNWGQRSETYDLDGDGVVGGSDLGILLANWAP